MDQYIEEIVVLIFIKLLSLKDIIQLQKLSLTSVLWIFFLINMMNAEEQRQKAMTEKGL